MKRWMSLYCDIVLSDSTIAVAAYSTVKLTLKQQNHHTAVYRERWIYGVNPYLLTPKNTLSQC